MAGACMIKRARVGESGWGARPWTSTTEPRATGPWRRRQWRLALRRQRHRAAAEDGAVLRSEEEEETYKARPLLYATVVKSPT